MFRAQKVGDHILFMFPAEHVEAITDAMASAPPVAGYPAMAVLSLTHDEESRGIFERQYGEQYKDQIVWEEFICAASELNERLNSDLAGYVPQAEALNSILEALLAIKTRD